ncbi:unnamed protein product [Camellia sinensis]
MTICQRFFGIGETRSPAGPEVLLLSVIGDREGHPRPGPARPVAIPKINEDGPACLMFEIKVGLSTLAQGLSKWDSKWTHGPN